MKRKMRLLTMLIAAAALPMFGFAAAIENVIALQYPGTGIVDIYYDLIINEGGTTIVSASVEGGDGEVRMETLSGDIGHVVPGPARHIVWNAQADNPERVISDLRVVISASKMDAAENPGMRKISGRYYYLYKKTTDSSSYITNTYVNIDPPIYIDRAPVSGVLWNKVASWAVRRGYRFKNSYSSSASVVHPALVDAWVWCNARSEMEGLPRCHLSSDGLSTFASEATPDGGGYMNGYYALVIAQK